jgi:hypothetical protein
MKNFAIVFMVFYALFKEIISSSVYVVSNDGVISEIMNWKGYGRKQS